MWNSDIKVCANWAFKVRTCYGVLHCDTARLTVNYGWLRLDNIVASEVLQCDLARASHFVDISLLDEVPSYRSWAGSGMHRLWRSRWVFEEWSLAQWTTDVPTSIPCVQAFLMIDMQAGKLSNHL